MIDSVLDQLNKSVVIYGPKFIAGFVHILAFLLAGWLIEKIIDLVGNLKLFNKDVTTLISRIVFATVVIIGVISGLGSMGINVSALIASLGLTGFALGFALRDALSNILSGILIMAYRPFRRADHISVTGFSGIVSKIDLRYTTLDAEGDLILIPNSILFTNPVTIVKKK